VRSAEARAALSAEQAYKQRTAKALRGYSSAIRRWDENSNHARALWLAETSLSLHRAIGNDEGVGHAMQNRIAIAQRVMSSTPPDSVDHLVTSMRCAIWLAEQGGAGEALTITARVRAEWSSRLRADDPILGVLGIIDAVAIANASIDAHDKPAMRESVATIERLLSDPLASADAHQMTRLLWSTLARLHGDDALQNKQGLGRAAQEIERLDAPPVGTL